MFFVQLLQERLFHALLVDRHLLEALVGIRAFFRHASAQVESIVEIGFPVNFRPLFLRGRDLLAGFGAVFGLLAFGIHALGALLGALAVGFRIVDQLRLGAVVQFQDRVDLHLLLDQHLQLEGRYLQEFERLDHLRRELLLHPHVHR